MHRYRNPHVDARLRVMALATLLLLLASCARPWTLDVSWNGQPLEPLTDDRWSAWAEAFPEDVQDKRNLSLERALYEMGVSSIEGVATSAGEAPRPWSEVADAAWLGRDGSLNLNGDRVQGEALILSAPAEAAIATASVTDVAPTICRALGVAAPAASTGKSLDAPEAEHVAFIFLDGLGYRRYLAGRPRALSPFLDSLGEPHIALTVYPSVTRVSTAAFITGAPPAANGVRDRNTRDTEAETIFDVLTAVGKTSVAVEGSALAFNLRNTELILSGDKDGNGGSDDNTYANAMDVIQNRMPDFLWVHFHGIDDQGHTYGPDAVEVDMKLAEVDGYVRDILAALPADTLVIIGSDHGMHSVEEGERLGNHGTLQPADMLVPLWTVMP